jgi:hypothetical protein
MSNTNHIITHKTSILVYRLIVYTDVTLKQFIFNNPNCICTLKNQWRCTYHASDYSMNVFVAKKLSTPAIVCMVFSKPKPIDDFGPEFERLFGARPDPKNITLVNRVEKFYTPYKELNFEGLYDDLDKCSDIGTFYIVDHSKTKNKSNGKPGKIPSYSHECYVDIDSEESNKPEPRVNMEAGDGMDNIEPLLSMNLQRFCAMMVQPFPNESNVMIEIFASGVLNVAGIPTEEYFQRIKKFITEELAPLLKNNARQNPNDEVSCNI